MKCSGPFGGSEYKTYSLSVSLLFLICAAATKTQVATKPHPKPSANPSSVYTELFLGCDSDVPCTQQKTFPVDPVPSGGCSLAVRNGDGRGTDEARSYEVFLNSERVIPVHHSGNAQVHVKIFSNNTLKVVLTGESFRKVFLEILCATASAFADDSYFPIKTKSGEEGVTPFEAQWFGKFLAQMKEPPLPEFTKDANAEVYRMMILPTWGNAILVRVQKHGAIYSLSARRLEGQAGFGVGKLVEAKDFELSAEDSKALEQLIRNLSFFQLATDDDVLGDDGDEWIFEGVSEGTYHVAKRWCASSYNPNKRGLMAFLNLCRFLVNKSTLSERPKNKGHKLI